MWEITSPFQDAPAARDGKHPKLATIFDVDCDGENEAILMTLINEPKSQDSWTIVNGKDGTIEKTVKLPFTSKHRGLVALGYLRGKPTPEIAVAFDDNVQTVAVYTCNLTLLWSIPFKENSGHYLWFFDIDDDRQQELFAGKYLLDEEGNFVWNMTNFFAKDHVDSLVCGDIDPEILRKEVVACGNTGIVCYDKDGNMLWTNPEVIDP